jgi:hypothetical protein
MLRQTALAAVLGLCLLALPAIHTQNTAASVESPYVCGDVDCNGAGPDIGDLTRLIGYLYIEPGPLVDPTRANLDGAAGIDIGDLTFLIGHLYLGADPPLCGSFVHEDESGSCLSGMETGLADGIGTLETEVIGNDLYIRHLNAFFNCCPGYYVNYSIDGSRITAVEGDSLYGCRCLCYFNTESVLHGLAEGMYEVTLICGQNFDEYTGDTVGVDTVFVDSAIGGNCEYIEYYGTATITSIDSSTHYSYCQDAVTVLFDFTPDDPTASSRYMFTNYPDTSRRLKVGQGMDPPRAWVENEGITAGSTFRCVRREEYQGTCTPYMHQILDLQSSWLDFCEPVP